MKTEPTGTSDDDMFFGGASLIDLIPRSCQYPPDVKQITQVLNMENLRKADMRTGFFSSDCVPDHSATARSTSYRRTRPQAVLHTASGSRASGPPPQTGIKSNARSDTMGSSRNNPQVTTDTLRITNLSENLSHGEPSHILHKAASGSLHPHPPKKRVFDKQGSKKLRVFSARGAEQTSASPDAVPCNDRKRSKSRQKGTLPSSGQESSQQPLTLTEKSEHPTADKRSCSPAKESSRVTPTPAEFQLCSIRPGLSSDLQVWSSWESNEGSEPQLTLQEEVFTFSSHPHSPKRGQGQGDHGKTEIGDDLVQNKSGRRYDAKPEDDFIGSESDEDKSYIKFQHQKISMSNPATSRAPDPALKVQHEGHSESPNMDQIFPEELSLPNTSMQPSSSGKAEPNIMVPARCLSPNRHKHKSGPRGSEEVNQFLDKNSSVSLSRRLLQEVKLGDSKRYK
uniref:Uncharacterized protein n=1 Tax=Acanthochromis polyacanthus TaxID=80966 RepID=A0A3Q1HSJ2_9TELE